MRTGYQTKPLTEYEQHLQQRAAALFDHVQALIGPRQTRRYKGSYSVFGTNHGTAVKIIIFQTDVGRLNGDRLEDDGVYVLIRSNGPQGDLMRDCPIWERVEPDRTIGIAPNHSERFGYFRLSGHDDLNGIARAIERCVKATQRDRASVADPAQNTGTVRPPSPSTPWTAPRKDPAKEACGSRMSRQLKIYAALREEIDDGHVWLSQKSLKPRCVVKIQANGKTVYCEVRQIDDNFIDHYNKDKSGRLPIEDRESSIVMGYWHRAKLGDGNEPLQTGSTECFLVEKALPGWGGIRAGWDHPQIVVRTAMGLALLSVVLGVLSCIW